MSPNLQEQSRETGQYSLQIWGWNRIGEEPASALKIFGFREEILNKVPKERKYGHLSARGWARHIAQDVYSTTRCVVIINSLILYAADSKLMFVLSQNLGAKSSLPGEDELLSVLSIWELLSTLEIDSSFFKFYGAK